MHMYCDKKDASLVQLVRGLKHVNSGYNSKGKILLILIGRRQYKNTEFLN